VVCDHLEAITRGEITRLIINIPPGTMKSLISSVFWPAWEWGPAGMPWLRYLTTSYSDAYVKRDSRKMRDLVNSNWYQARWPHVKLVRTGETSFENTEKGNREGRPFSGLTGGRGDRVIIDDPHSTESAESELDRQTAIRIFTESVPTRLNRPIDSAILVIMQRLHVEDVTGKALSLGLGYEHLMLPMEYEPDRQCHTSIGFKDRRTVEGELLFPERFPKEVVDRDKIPMGSYAVAGQFQQRPTLREGGLFKRSWFHKVSAAQPGTRWVRYWDLAATSEQLTTSAAYTVGMLVGRQQNGRFIIDISALERFRSEGHGVRKRIKEIAKDDGTSVEIGFPQDPGQAGKVQARDFVQMLGGYVAYPQLESGDKATRAEPVASHAEMVGMDYLDDGTPETAEKLRSFFAELEDFPGGKFKDQVDALSGAFARLHTGGIFDTSEFELRMDTPFEKRRLMNGTDTMVVRLAPVWPRVCAIELERTRVGIVWAAAQFLDSNDLTKNTMTIYEVASVARTNYGAITELLRQRGQWIPILIDPEGKDRTLTETEAFCDKLMTSGFSPLMVDGFKLEAGVEDLVNRMAEARLKVFDINAEWFNQFRRFTRDEKNEIVISNDTGLIRASALLSQNMQMGVTENQASSDAQGFDPVEYDRIENGNSGGY